MKYILGLLGSLLVGFLVTFFVTPQIMKLSHKIGFTDKPTERKKHRGEVPLCGGIGMYIGFFIVYFLFVNDNRTEQFWVFIGATLILGIGLVDDYYKAHKKEFPIYPRFIVQILAAVLVFKAGIAFPGFTNPFSSPPQYIELSQGVQFILTITWIFGVTTVINWSDGMDGLAGGVSLISSLTFFGAAVILKQQSSAVISLALAGVVFAFLIYNKYPAKTFMGDSGANFLGFILSIIALDGAFKQATVMSLFIPLFALAVPIFDNLFVILKRFSEGKPVYQADRSQIHYRLEEKGLNNTQIVKFIMSISLIFSTLSILLLLIKK